ncbi:LysE family transporter [Vibrio sp. H11]|uniref:LysE family transporter n=1 Tax=Vibrio sp. H11 TaxID=2565928 RepID=UPI0023EF4F54|nr:LysE family transporter [Vibrio sp. H11]
MSPGPSFIFVARRAISLSRRHGIFTTLGMGTGALVLSVAALLGLQTIFSLIPVSYLKLQAYAISCFWHLEL